MHIAIEHRPGPQQYQVAMDYFRQVITDTIRDQSPDHMECTQYVISEEGQPEMPVRVWERPDGPNLDVSAKMLITYEVISSMKTIGHAHTRDQLSKALGSLPRHLTSELPTTFFMEVLHPAPEPFSPEEHTRLLFGVVGNELAFVSADDLRLVRLDKSLYGLAVQGSGSFLLNVDEKRAA